jgi:uroporphyrinogen III methyltransferase/synthase
MGIQNIGHISEQLMAGGRSPDTPVAIIANGTLPTQRTVTGTLATIVRRAEEEDIAPPGLIVVGEVVGLRAQLGWFENRPLFGRSLLVTRARAQASELVAKLEGLGAEVISSPVIRMESLGDTPAMRAAAREARNYDWIVFTSVNGVDAFLESLKLEGLDVRALAGSRLAAIGPATGDRLVEKGLNPDLVPARFVAEALLEALDKTEPFKGQRYLLPRSDLARADLADGLKARGAEVTGVPAYKTLEGEPFSDGVVARLECGGIDLVTFTSSSTVRNFVDTIPADHRSTVLGQVRAASIGPITSATLQEMNIPIAVTAAESTIPSLTEAIVAHFRK